MTRIDLITGFLGAGKTEFLKRYARFLMAQGEKICILENDFGAINVDMILLHDLQEEGCDLEMIIGGDGAEAHRRRFKTKLIAMGMKGYDRVLIEPSGIFDMDEFFDVLYEEPLDVWYQVGNIFAIVDAGLEGNISEASEYLLASEAADAGKVIFSKCQETDAGQIRNTLMHLNRALEKFQCSRRFRLENILTKNWDELTEEDFQKLRRCEYVHADLVKMPLKLEEAYETQFVMGVKISGEELEDKCRHLLTDERFGHIFRIKGFIPDHGAWLSVNATREKLQTESISAGQEVLIMIGEHLDRTRIEEYWKQGAVK